MERYYGRTRDLDERHTRVANETYVLAVYLPNKDIDVIVKHPELTGVNFLRARQYNRKHLGLNHVDAPEKRVKKVKEIRHFVFGKSVFAPFKPDTVSIIDKAFEHDKELTKIPKFVKDESDREATYKVFRKYYFELKNQFVSQIANPKSYPVIDWLDFVDACSQWKIIDKNLTSTDVDRIFIATNFEEEDLEENDDNSLCRFEFMEIIARMAKTKYFDKDTLPTVAESCEKLITEYIIPNTTEHMEWQAFRDNYLWTLDVDDLLKANLDRIAKLYKMFTQARRAKHLTCEHFLEMVEQSGMPVTEKQVVIAYALSKATVSAEMADFDNYNKMNQAEFFEAIGRLAYQLYKEAIPLSKKIERVLGYLLPLVGTTCTLPDLDADIESDSDYDDDWVDDFIQQELYSIAAN